MNAIRVSALVAATSLLLCSCYSAPVMPPLGAIYSNIDAPLQYQPSKTNLGARSGQASSYSLFGAVAWGDCSVEKAAASGDIKTIKHLDYKYTNFFGIYQKFTVVAYGD